MPTFATRAKEIRNQISSLRLAILIWGPGNPGIHAPIDKQKAFQKRVQIKDILRTNFPNSEVYLSEDLQMKNLSRGIIGQLNKQALQAKSADVIIMLDLTRGVDLELDYFVPKYTWFPRKSYVLLPKQFVRTKGLVKEILNFFHDDHIIGFSDDEFSKCKVAKVMAMNIARTAALNKILE